MFDAIEEAGINLIELTGSLFEGKIDLPITALRRGVTKRAKETNYKALKRDNFNVLTTLMTQTRIFCLSNWKRPSLLALYHIWSELRTKMDILKLIMEPMYNGQIGVKLPGFTVSNDWTYQSNIHLTEVEMVIYKTFYDTFLTSGTIENDQINKLIVKGLESFWLGDNQECCWFQFEEFCTQFKLVTGGSISCLNSKRDLMLRSIVQFHRKNVSADSIILAIGSIRTMKLNKLDEEIILKSMIRVNCPPIVELLSKNVQTDIFQSILQIYMEFNWPQDDFNLAIDEYIHNVIPSFDGINERSSKSITQLISKCLEISESINDNQFNGKEKYIQCMIKRFDKFQRNFPFHLSKFIINQLKSITKISNRNDMELQWDKFIIQLKPILKSFKSNEMITLLKNLAPPMTNLLLYDFSQLNASTQFNMKDCLNNLIPLLGDENQLQYTVKQIMDACDQFNLFKNAYNGPDVLLGDIICCKSNQFDDIKDFPTLEKLEIPREIKQQLEAFVQFNGKGETFWDLKKFKFQLQFGDDIVIHCNVNQFNMLMKFNDNQMIPIEQLGGDSETVETLLNAKLIKCNDTSYIINESIPAGVIRLK